MLFLKLPNPCPKIGFSLNPSRDNERYFPRELLREKINIMKNNSEIFSNLKSNLVQIIWKVNDFFTGIIDIRDTHNATKSNSIFAFLLRISTGTFFMAPITYISLIGIFLYKKLLLKTNLWICLVASIFAISPSLIGVAMSRYYFMFITPFILTASVLLTNIYTSKLAKKM